MASEWNRPSWTGNRFVSWSETSQQWATARSSRLSLRLTLYRDLPFAELEVSLVKPPDPWPESGWICLPTNIDQPRFRLGRLAAVIDPTRDIVEGANAGQFVDRKIAFIPAELFRLLGW